VQLEAFDALIAKLERRAESHPRLYTAQVVAMAALGFGVVGLLLLAGLGLLAAAVLGCIFALKGLRLWLALGCVGGALTWNVLRALWVRFEPPPGLVAGPDLAPRLLEEVESVRRALGAPRIHRVLLDGQLNASMTQQPLLGILGWHRNHLLLGIPLLRAVSLEEFRAVLAHEIGHLLGGHSRFGAWIYRVRAAWGRLYDALAARGGGRFTGRFLAWYAPLFNAYSFVLARRQEREADAASVRVSSAEDAGRALRRFEVLARQAEERFWPPLWRRAVREPAPPPGYLDALRDALAVPDPLADRWHHEALLTHTDRADTPPAHRDRLDGLGFRSLPDRAPEPPASTAASALLGSGEAEVVRKLDSDWAARTAEGWAERHAACRYLAKRRAELETKPAEGPEERLELTRLVEELEGPEAALPLAQALAEAHPAHPGARYLAGRLLLHQGDPAGIGHVEKAMELDGEAVRPGAALLRDWHRRQGRATAVRRLDLRAEARGEDEEKAAEERNRLPKPAELFRALLSPEEIAAISACGAKLPELLELHVVEVSVAHLPERRHFLVVVRADVPWWKPRSQDADSKLAQAVADGLPLPGSTIVIHAKGTHAGLARKAVKAAGGAPVYRKRK
jgi:Zn-dependent protease with chaperone function